MKDHIKIQIQEKLTKLINNLSNDSNIIPEIYEYCKINRQYVKEICEAIVQRALFEKHKQSKLAIICSIDSIIRNIGAEYIQCLSPNIFRLFDDAYAVADEEGKFKLFKFFYSWKYFLNENVLESLSSKFKFSELINKLKRENPELIKRYDEYNDKIKEMKSKEFKEIKEVKETREFKEEKIIPISSTQEREKITKNNINNSLLSKIGVTASQTKNKKRRRGDDGIFSSKSSSKEHSDEERKDYKKQRISKIADDIENFTNLNIKKKKFNTSTSGQDQFDNNFLHVAQQPKIIQTPPVYNQPTLVDNSNTQQEIILKFLQMLNNNQLQVPPSNQILSNQILPTTHIPSVHIPASPKKRGEELFIQTTSSYPSFNFINSFINKSTCQIKSNIPFFASVSKFFQESIDENSILNNLLIEYRDQIRNKVEILDIRDTSKDSYKDVIQKSIDSLSTDLKNICSICGFRTKFYHKFTEHLDIHFHINYIKRNSQKKVLYRKESQDKKSWIRSENENYNRSNNNLNRESYTINSVLFYQNDADHFISNKKDLKCDENVNDNEKAIYAVQQGEEICCVYCGEEFKKKFISKFNYWFYINIFKINKDNLISGLEEILNSNSFKYNTEKEILIHENCIEEFLKMVKIRDSIKI